MKNNIINFAEAKEKLCQNEINNEANDETVLVKKNKTTISTYHLRYGLALMVNVIVILPLMVLSAFGFLIKIIGYLCMIALTGFYFMDANISPWVLGSGWLFLFLLERVNNMLDYWTENRLAFKLFGVNEN